MQMAKNLFRTLRIQIICRFFLVISPWQCTMCMTVRMMRTIRFLLACSQYSTLVTGFWQSYSWITRSHIINMKIAYLNVNLAI